MRRRELLGHSGRISLQGDSQLQVDTILPALQGLAVVTTAPGKGA